MLQHHMEDPNILPVLAMHASRRTHKQLASIQHNLQQGQPRHRPYREAHALSIHLQNAALAPDIERAEALLACASRIRNKITCQTQTLLIAWQAALSLLVILSAFSCLLLTIIYLCKGMISGY